MYVQLTLPLPACLPADDGDLGRAYLNADSAVHEQQQDLGLEIREREAQEMRALERYAVCKTSNHTWEVRTCINYTCHLRCL